MLQGLTNPVALTMHQAATLVVAAHPSEAVGRTITTVQTEVAHSADTDKDIKT